MAAAALIELAGGSAASALYAARHALQGLHGLVCDPIASRFGDPCLGPFVAGASTAIACANIALVGYDHLIPLDECSTRTARPPRASPASCAAPH